MEPDEPPPLPRLRQAVFATRDLDATVTRLRDEFALGEPCHDPAVAYFGLRNAVFAVGDQFLEVVSPTQGGTSAGRLLDRRGGDCGYMAMFQVADVAAARGRAAGAGVREVFEVAFDDITEAHLHPADMRGAIVSVSEPVPAESWRWGGEGWSERGVAGAIAGITVAVADPEAVRARWNAVIGGTPAVEFVADPADPGLTAIAIEREGALHTLRPGG